MSKDKYSHLLKCGCEFYIYMNLIYKFTTSVRDGAQVSRRPGLARPVLRVFFQKICGFRAGISCSQNFLSKDLWFPSSGTGQSGRCTVCRGPKTQVTFKTIPPVPRAQKLFRTSIAHFYFFTYQVLNPDQSRSQVPTPRLQRSER